MGTHKILISVLTLGTAFTAAPAWGQAREGTAGAIPPGETPADDTDAAEPMDKDNPKGTMPDTAEPYDAMRPESTMDTTTPPPAPARQTNTYEKDSEGGAMGFLHDYGLSLSVGGGVTGFTDSSMRDATEVGGLWDVRVGFMTNRAIGVEVAYQGGLQSIDALGLDTDAQLLSNELEALARVNFLTGRWVVQPYAFAGAAWRRYGLTNVETNTSDVNDEDDVFEIPLGIGLGFRASGFLVDLRGSFRPALDSDLVPNPDGDGSADMHAWSSTLRLGYAF